MKIGKPKKTAPKAKIRSSRAERRSGAGRALIPDEPRGTRKRQAGGGARVNGTIKMPKPPGPWVTEEQNLITGQRYKDFRSSCDFKEAARRIRAASRAQGYGDGYRSRGPMLHAMRVCKMEAWYEEALRSEGMWNHKAGRPYTPQEFAAELKRSAAEHGGESRRRAYDPYFDDDF